MEWDSQLMHPMHEIKAWVESDTEHPAPGELVAVATYTATYIEITGVAGPFLCLEHIIEPYPIWDYYTLLDQYGHIRRVNVGFHVATAIAHAVCRYENRKRCLASDFLKSYIGAGT